MRYDDRQLAYLRRQQRAADRVREHFGSRRDYGSGDVRIEMRFEPEQGEFAAAMRRYENDLRMDTAEATRRAMTDLLKSIRARTIIAPKRRRVEPVRSRRPGSRQVVIMVKHGRYAGQMAKLWRIERRGKWTYAPAPKRSDIAATGRLEIHNRGLAKRSWGWAMHELFGDSPPATPPGAAPVTSGMVAARGVTDRDSITFEVRNRLGYIRHAVSDVSLRAAYSAAARSITAKVERRISGRSK